MEESCASQWRNDPTIRAEFPTLESFTAYTQDDSAGRALQHYCRPGNSRWLIDLKR